MTAAEVATATGLARATVSTTLSRLAKNGEVLKADRGYRRPEADNDAAHNPADATPAR
jgi:CRP-like cAMP-binding protein